MIYEEGVSGREQGKGRGGKNKKKGKGKSQGKGRREWNAKLKGKANQKFTLIRKSSQTKILRTWK